MAKPVGSHIMLLQIETPCIVSKKNWKTKETKVAPDACYVAAVVGEKVCVRMKQCRAVKTSSL